MIMKLLQPFHSQIYENHLELLLDYHTRPRSNNIPIEQIVKEVTTPQQSGKEPTTCSSTNHIYQNIPKEPPKEKIWTIPFPLESAKSKEFQPPDLETDFLIDSGAESNIINIPTWNEIKTLHPKLTPVKTTSRLATAQGSTLTKFNFSLSPLKQWNKINFSINHFKK